MTPEEMEQKATEFSQRVSASHRVHAELYLADKFYTSVTAIVKAAYLEGLKDGLHAKS